MIRSPSSPIALAVLATGLVAGAAVFAATTADARGHGPRGGHHQMLERLDTNDDGKITRREAEAHRAAALDDFDANTDGALSLDEFEALWTQKMRERMVDGFQRLDADGSGTVTADEMARPTDRMFRRLDSDGNGVIEGDEMTPRRRHGPKGERD